MFYGMVIPDGAEIVRVDTSTEYRCGVPYEGAIMIEFVGPYDLARHRTGCTWGKRETKPAGNRAEET